MNVMNVGKLSARRQTLEYVREVTQGRNPINVMSVGEISPMCHTSEYIREFTREKTL